MCKRLLLALDFDHTVLNSNSDIEVQRLAKGGQIPSEVRKLYSTRSWTNFMQKVFETLHGQGVSADQYHQCLHAQKFVPGMKELLKDAGDNADVDVIIISDSNTLFIDSILKHHGLSAAVDQVFSNPAHFDADGCLQIRYFHVQTDCPYSSTNLCKGRILTDYLNARRAGGLQFDTIIYVGDGTHDLCPALKLRAIDHVFARKDYSLAKLISTGCSNGVAVPNLKASVHFWESGYDILSLVRSLDRKGTA